MQRSLWLEGGASKGKRAAAGKASHKNRREKHVLLEKRIDESLNIENFRLSKIGDRCQALPR